MAANENKGLIIDEDWKSKVERERDLAREESVKGVAADAEPAAEEAESPFERFITYIATQCAGALGAFAEQGQQVYVDLDFAQFAIDGLLMLREKTKGNLTPVEQGSLSRMISHLQQGYFEVSQIVQQSQMQGLNINPQQR